MNPYLFWGLVIGTFCAVGYTIIAICLKKQPALAHTVEIIISSVGASGGAKMFSFVITGNLTLAAKTNPSGLSDEDLVYVLIGGFALFWLSVQTIFRRFIELKTQQSAQTNPPTS